MITLELPIPPSVNHCWRHTRNGSFRTSKYIAWLKRSSLVLPNGPTIQGPYSCSIRVTPGEGWNIVRDIDNISKCALDLLQSGNHPVVAGDDCRRLQRLLIHVGQPEQKARLTVRIKPIRGIAIATKREQKKNKKVAAAQGQPMEGETTGVDLFTLEELRKIARDSKARGKALARSIAQGMRGAG